MSDKEKDFDEGIDFNEENFNKRFRRIERPAFLDKIPKNVSLRDCKSRITIHLDADIVEHYKQAAQNVREGYQTLINQTLRDAVDKKVESESSRRLQSDLLNDRRFLAELKEKLETI